MSVLAIVVFVDVERRRSREIVRDLAARQMRL